MINFEDYRINKEQFLDFLYRKKTFKEANISKEDIEILTTGKLYLIKDSFLIGFYVKEFFSKKYYVPFTINCGSKIFVKKIIYFIIKLIEFNKDFPIISAVKSYDKKAIKFNKYFFSFYKTYQDWVFFSNYKIIF